jgi:dTDP-glucose 4,6-dehydratase
MKKYLITGGAGFIGSHFIEMLLNQGKDVLVFNLDKLTYAGKLENMPFLNHERHFFVHGDICDQLLVQELFKTYDFDVVVNFAAESHVDNSIIDPEVFFRTNILGVTNLLNAAKDVWEDYAGRLFVQISTDEVYGSLGNEGLFSEDSLISPNSPYSSSKASADLIVMSFFRTYGLPIIITRSSNNYGPRQDIEKLVPKVITNSLLGRKIPVYGNGLNIRDWIFVKDNCLAIKKVVSHGKVGEVYNIGGNNEVSNLDLIKQIIKLTNSSTSLIEFVSDRKGHDYRYALDVNKLSDLTGEFLLTKLESGILITIDYYKKILFQGSI